MTIDLLCLALVIYHEARGESIEGRIAVAETVFSRIEKGAYPDSVCGVAGQAKQYAVSTAADILPREPEAWQEALLIADAILADPEGTLPGTGATHFHTTAISPYWNREMEPAGKIGNHIFWIEK